MKHKLRVIAVVVTICVALLLSRSPNTPGVGSSESDVSSDAIVLPAAPQGSSGTGPSSNQRETARFDAGPERAAARRTTSRNASPEEEATIAAQPLVFLIDGAPCPEFRIAFVAEGSEAIEEVPASALRVRLAQGLDGLVAFASALITGEAPRWSGFVPVADLSEAGFTLSALPLPAVRGLVVTVDSEEAIDGASIVARLPAQGRALAWLLGDSYEASTISGADGRFVLQLATTGAYRIEARSPHHLARVHELEVHSDTDIGAALTLVPRPVLRVTLEGASGDPSLHYAAHTLHGTRVPFEPDWTTAVPLDPDVAFLDLAVGVPGGIEVTTFFAGASSDYPDGVTIALGAAALDISVVGVPLDDQRLVALVFSTLPDGTEVLLTRWIAAGETVRVPLGTSGEVAVDVAWKNEDDSPRTILRRRVEAAPGRVTPVTIELPKRLHRVQLVDAESRAILVGEVWFSTGAEGRLTAPGGTLDADGTQLVPDLDQTSLWLHGMATENEVPFAGIRLDAPPAMGELSQVALGEVVRTEIELVPTNGALLHSEYAVEFVCARTGQMATYYRVPATGQITLSWFDASDAALALPPATTWSPREPVPLTAGSMRIPVVLRAWCAIETGGVALVDLQHVESGLSLADLERDPTVRREPYSAGERWWGVPAGHYRVTLAGDEAPRGPFAVAPGAWVTVPAAGQ